MDGGDTRSASRVRRRWRWLVSPLVSAVPSFDPPASGSEPEPKIGAPLRRWQRQALTHYLRNRPTDYLAVATPGAGKTTFALRVAAELLADRSIAAITVVAPTEHLKNQWAAAAAAMGIALDPTFTNSHGAHSRDYQGVVVTYAQVAAAPMLHRARSEARRTLVILDEVHHTGDAKSWGEAVREAFGPAARRLALTGTPFRSDDNPIPFVRYEKDAEGFARSAADSSYGYADALADGVVRPVLFLAYSGQTRWRTRAGDEVSATLGELLTPDATARAWRTALDPKGEWVPSVLTAADVRLSQVRASGMPDAGGLVIASDQAAARAYAKHLRQITGIAPVVVLSDERGASAKIAEFSASDERWMVAVRMVSEGVDVPRLAVGVYATNASTPLYFAQAVGRFVRMRRSGEAASIFLPSVRSLLALAGEMETVRDHVLGKPRTAEEELWDDAEVREANAERSEPDDNGFEALEASAHLDQLIFDGASFGGATATTPEDHDFIGLPGLLSAEQMTVLLKQRRGRQEAEQAAAPRTEAPATAPDASSAAIRPPHEVKAELRRELALLVAARHHRTGAPHAAIHGELRSACGGPQVAIATADQIRERIAMLRKWASR
ncbi:MAG: type restriction enzyme res subunit [Pseudonocardiales bacterium]|nr:type restriction enzyme res subunit [Pseudonocardiales bacterium]